MPVPNVDTFEHDISEEIRTKEASFTDIASAGGDVGNTEPPRSSNLALRLGIACLVVAVLSVPAYFLLSKEAPSPTTQTENVPQGMPSVALNSISPALESGIASYVDKISQSEYGYVVTITSYTPVFAFMIKNEQAFAHEMARALNVQVETGTTTTPFSFTDATFSNQNMRIGTSGSSTIAYAFINEKTVAIASSAQGILTLRGSILSK